jgi:hypothetical protein
MESVEAGANGSKTMLSSYSVTAVDRTGNESEFVEYQIGGGN